MRFTIVHPLEWLIYERASAPSTTGLYHRHASNKGLPRLLLNRLWAPLQPIMALPFRSQISRQPLAVTGYRVNPQQPLTILGI
jgi:hypothetical protein